MASLFLYMIEVSDQDWLKLMSDVDNLQSLFVFVFLKMTRQPTEIKMTCI